MSPKLEDQNIMNEIIEKPERKEKGVIRTMPDYFRNSAKNNKSKIKAPKNQSSMSNPKKKRGILMILVILLVLILIVVIGFVLYSSYQKSLEGDKLQEQKRQEELEKEKQSEEDARLKAEEEQKRIEEEERLQSQEEKQKRDAERLGDINLIQTSLEDYFADMKRYPEEVTSNTSLATTENTYIEKVPQNPEPGGSKYIYTVAPSDALSYTISFTLETQIGELEQGLNTATSERQITKDGKIITIKSKRKELIEQSQTVLSSLDSDLDGLTDVEESFYLTDKDEFDSDNDSYSDKQELINLYNPSGIAPVRLIESGNVDEYTNPTFDYYIYYPKNWVVKPLDQTNREVIFTSTTGEFIEVLIEDNISKLSLEEWFKNQYTEEELKRTQIVSTKDNKLAGIRSADRRRAYFAQDQYIYIIIHNFGTKTEVDYSVTYEMMIKSFRFSEEEDEQNNAEIEENEDAIIDSEEIMENESESDTQDDGTDITEV